MNASEAIMVVKPEMRVIVYIPLTDGQLLSMGTVTEVTDGEVFVRLDGKIREDLPLTVSNQLKPFSIPRDEPYALIFLTQEIISE